MENTLTSFINRVDFVKNSEMGNPIYRVTFTPSKGKTMIGYTRSKSHLSQICPSFEGDTCDVTYDINDKGKVIVRDIKKCGGEMNESKLKKIINESVRKTLNELDWKTYANAAKKRLQQDLNKKPDDKTDYFDKYFNLNKMANQKFDDDFVGLMKYDTMGDKWRGKKSPKFDARFDLGRKQMPYGAVKGTNKGGDTIFSNAKDRYYSNKGYTTPNSFFRNKEVADAYKKANDELWDYENGNYDYKKGEGWQLKESKLRRIVGESMNRVLKENANVPDFYDFVDILERNGWSYSDYQNVQTKDGRSAKRYIVYKDDKNSSDFKTLQQGLKNTFGDNVDFGIAQYRYAPEIKHYTVIILDYNDDDASAPLNESKLRSIIKESMDRVMDGQKEKVKIIFDPENVYKAGSVVNVNDLIKDYLDTVNDDWILRVDKDKAVDFIADAWGLKIE